MKKLLLAAAIIFCAAGLAQAIIIDDFTQDRTFTVGSPPTAGTYTDYRNDSTNMHIIGGRCDITLYLYAGDTYLGFYPLGNGSYPANGSYNSNFSSSGVWTLEYGKSTNLNANLVCADVDAIKIDFNGDMYGGGFSCPNPLDYPYFCPRPVPATMTIISKKGTAQEKTNSKTISLLNPAPEAATNYFYFSDFPDIDFTDVDYIKLSFDNVTQNAVDYSIFKIYTDCPTTAITLSQFDAIPGNGQVVVTWKTETEIDNVGFNLYRSEKKHTGYEKINDALIPAEGSDIQGASYQFIDTPLKNRKVYYYKLEDVDISGLKTMNGPVKSIPRFIHVLKK